MIHSQFFTVGAERGPNRRPTFQRYRLRDASGSSPGMLPADHSSLPAAPPGKDGLCRLGTHVTSAQRMRWFKKGLQSGRLEDGDAFSMPYSAL